MILKSIIKMFHIRFQTNLIKEIKQELIGTCYVRTKMVQNKLFLVLKKCLFSNILQNSTLFDIYRKHIPSNFSDTNG